MERMNRWFSTPLYTRLQMVLYTVNLIWLGITQDFIVFIFNTTVIFLSFMSFRYKFKTVFFDFLAILDPKKSKELQLDELVYKIKRYCEIYNIEFMKSEQKKLLKRRKKHGK